MKQRHLAALAAFLVGVMGGAAFGDDHGGGPIVGPQENCSNYPWWCWGQCAELNACRSGNTPIGGSDCGTEEANLRSCEISPPPFIPPPPVIVVPPPACPAGLHLHESGCHADHVCGDDEIGGGSEDCEPCGEGEVPNPDGTACQSCPHGEASSGVCAADPCGIDALDKAASDALWNWIERKPYEVGAQLYCHADDIHRTNWETSDPDNVCAVDTRVQYLSPCWTFGNPSDGCDLAAVHTQPYFTEADRGARCNGIEIDERWAKFYNDLGMDFSQGDIDAAASFFVDAYLGVSDRSCARADRTTSGGPPAVIAGSCTPTPLSHKKWRNP